MESYVISMDDDGLVTILSTYKSGVTQKNYLTQEQFRLLECKHNLINKVVTESDLDKLIDLAVQNEQNERSFDEEY